MPDLPAVRTQGLTKHFGNLSGNVDTAYRDDLVERFEVDLDKRTRSYSKGNRQKVALMLGVVLSLPQWVLDLSPYAWLPRPPLEPWAAGPSLALTALGILAAAIGILGFARRDLQPD